MWVARDKNNWLYLYTEKPEKGRNEWNSDEDMIEINSSLFPEVKWEDEEPLEVAIVPKTNQNEKHEESKSIDWEQRRYEIAKAAAQGYCIALGMNDDSDTYNDIAIGAIRVADALIKKLKKGE